MGRRLAEKVALVTGAAQGIGKEIAIILAREGAHVVITDINDEAGQSVADEIGGSSVYMHLDVSSEADWCNVEQVTIDTFSKLDILVNNAAISKPQDIEHCSLTMWREVQAVNIEGAVLGCKYAIQMMKTTTKSGSIINIASAAGLMGFAGNPAYCASKAAVINLTKSVAMYCCQEGYSIRCNSLLPTFILTPLVSSMAEDERFQAYIKSTPMGKMGMPEDVAYAVLFFASNESKFITGTELIIDGGIMATVIPLDKKIIT